MKLLHNSSAVSVARVKEEIGPLSLMTNDPATQYAAWVIGYLACQQEMPAVSKVIEPQVCRTSVF